MTKNVLNIHELNLDSELKINGLVDSVQEFMGPFGDSEEECREAVLKCSGNGIALEAVLGMDRVGVVVLIKMPFDSFQPKYHLAYIATNATVRGQGIGKKLLERVVTVTEGDVSLHVGVANRNATDFYKRMNWNTVYLRMMPEKRKLRKSAETGS
ncbi:GNAT family N-acetyltransferase [bacterium]|nr:GNAT family N-acetyltransferase [bacterium]